MASIFKRSKRKNEPYWIQYTNHLGKRKTAKGFTDKGLTEQLAGKLESEARLRKTGLIDPEQERYAEVKQAALKTHLTAFEESLADNSPKHCTVTMSRVNRIVEGCGFTTLADIQSEPVQAFLRSLRKRRGHFAADVQPLYPGDGFVLQLVRDDKAAPGQPLAGAGAAEHGSRYPPPAACLDCR